MSVRMSILKTYIKSYIGRKNINISIAKIHKIVDKTNKMSISLLEKYNVTMTATSNKLTILGSL